MPEAPKACVVCGREITWRKKWARDWANVKYCSDACRRRKTSDTDAELESAMIRLLAERGVGKTICPSEAARAVGAAEWEGLMEATRMAARRLVERGEIVITQGGKIVDPSRARGPIRLKLLRA